MHVMRPIGEEEGHVHSLGRRLKGRFPVDHLMQVGIMLAPAAKLACMFDLL